VTKPVRDIASGLRQQGVEYSISTLVLYAGSGVPSYGTGSFSWPISTTGMLGSDFKVGVRSISKPTIKDASNNIFTITPPVSSIYYPAVTFFCHFTSVVPSKNEIQPRSG